MENKTPTYITEANSQCCQPPQDCTITCGKGITVGTNPMHISIDKTWIKKMLREFIENREDCYCYYDEHKVDEFLNKSKVWNET